MTARKRDFLADAKVHWPKLDAFGNVVPACNHIGGYQKRPPITQFREAITCERCVGIANRERGQCTH